MSSTRRSASFIARVAVLLSLGTSLGAQPCTDPAVCGRWSAGINLWAMHATCECDGPNFTVPNPCYEIAHMTLVSSGPKEGWVLFWRSDPNCGAPTYIWQPPSGTTVFDMTVPRGPGHANHYCNPSYLPCSAAAALVSVFCSGHSYLGDGRLVVAGGNETCQCSGGAATGTNGYRQSYIFDPAVLTGSTGGWAAWTPIPGQTLRRWYPSALTLADGSVLIAGGLADDCTLPKTYQDSMEMLLASNPTGWIILPWGGSPPLELPGSEAFRLYPHVRLLTGSPPGAFPTTADVVLTSHEGGIHDGSTPNCNTAYRISRTSQLDITALPNSAYRRVEGSSAPIPGYVDRFALVGGREAAGSGACPATASGTAIADVEDIQSPQNGGATWALNTWGPLNVGRVYSNPVILPDGSLLVVGGSDSDYQLSGASFIPAPVYPAERLVPSPGQAWTTMASQDSPRLYHSVLLLLPDGTVLSAGGDFFDPCSAAGCFPAGYGGINLNCSPLLNTPEFRFRSDVEIYSPPYLFQGPRPSFAGFSSTVMFYNGSINATVRIPPNAIIDRFVLIRPGSVTHGTDFEQRYVQPSHVPTFPPSPNWQVQTFTISSPVNGWQAQPGYWMLFAVTNTGIPSVAQFVRVQ